MTVEARGRGRTLSLRIERRSDPKDDGAFTLDVAFDVPPGVTVLFGPSGAGKSTTLRCIAGLDRPTRGRIVFGDEIWFDAGADVFVPAHRRAVGMVFQSLALFPHMTAEENVAYGIPRARSSNERTARAREWLERMRVPHLAKRRPRTFSGGEAQRVALARAFAVEPKLLLLDEPFSSLDAHVKHALVEEARAWIERTDVSAILVTHDRADAERLGQRTVSIEDGKIHRELKSSSLPSVREREIELEAFEEMTSGMKGS